MPVDENSSSYPAASRYEHPDKSGPPWWVVVVFGAALTTALASAGWAVQGVLAMRIEQTSMAKDVAQNAKDLGRLEGKIQASPSRDAFEAMRSEIAGLRDDVKRLSEQIDRRR